MAGRNGQRIKVFVLDMFNLIQTLCWEYTVEDNYTQTAKVYGRWYNWKFMFGHCNSTNI